MSTDIVSVSSSFGPPVVRSSLFFPFFFFTTDGYRIFNVRTNLNACRTDEEGSDTSKFAQEDCAMLRLSYTTRG